MVLLAGSADGMNPLQFLGLFASQLPTAISGLQVVCPAIALTVTRRPLSDVGCKPAGAQRVWAPQNEPPQHVLCIWDLQLWAVGVHSARPSERLCSTCLCTIWLPALALLLAPDAADAAHQVTVDPTGASVYCPEPSGCTWYAVSSSSSPFANAGPPSPALLNLIEGAEAIPREYFIQALVTHLPRVTTLPLTQDFSQVEPAVIVTLSDVRITCQTLQSRQVGRASTFTSSHRVRAVLAWACLQRLQSLQTWLLAHVEVQVPGNLPLAVPSATTLTTSDGPVPVQILPLGAAELGYALICERATSWLACNSDAGADHGSLQWQTCQGLRGDPAVACLAAAQGCASNFSVACCAGLSGSCCWKAPMLCRRVLS